MEHIKPTIAGIIMILALLIGIPQETSTVPEPKTVNKEKPSAIRQPEISVWVTAYSSTPEETDSTPFITASGAKVQDGFVAANFLPFGTKIKIPEFFDDKVFTVKDRMHKRKTQSVDIWMPTKERAKQFGRHKTNIVVVSSPEDPELALLPSDQYLSLLKNLNQDQIPLP